MIDDHAAPLAVSMGEPAGIGPDLILRLFSERKGGEVPPFIVYGNAQFLRERASRLGLSIEIVGARPGAAGVIFPHALPVCDVEGDVPDTPGEPQAGSASVVIEAIAAAVADTRAGACRAVVTAPIHKAALYGAGFSHPGHTEYLAALCATDGVTPLPLMMLAHEDLRVVPATIHVPLHEVPKLITTELLIETGRILSRDLAHRFDIAVPRIAFAGLNPHAGEAGTIGLEDRDIIAPAVAALEEEGIAVQGPFPADTLFYPPHWRQHDAIVAMYHDQALIPIKTVAFDSAVNVTLGLPIVRTSPDHGTAFDLAGTGRGSAASFRAALKLADRMAEAGR
ncbi:4-hydroxythreonine-4-phosphate dehydrogenase PdxA [Arsenicitalea aurantiaca]|uniref:4-hydroxythreonine-4-phosphate dehydrogenase n=1 Tax=Arsenicitalea aurantiaca TaxID=1783274 RepID=A0A433X391_9HYPH|nr:4-hydroxythreonine-4-phosphate dehydrogenase PdxA [Arsenicitalea aurantiaca]RUT28531.1 4-hydroxythreonine-4-phosphate dehydrogenase PdxA [Arsenicitalea aurantiaca]